MNIKYCIKTFGCTLNSYDSNLMDQILNENGYEKVKSIENADVAIINTCGVKDATEKRIINLLQNIKKPLVVAGCIATGNKKLVRKFCPNAVIVYTNSVQHICSAMEDALRGKTTEYINGNGKASLSYEPRGVVYNIGVSEGCASNCAYCFTKLARPGLKSMRIGEIINRILRADERGVKEIRLTAQDMGAYGIERGINTAQLLSKIAKLKIKPKIRVGMMNPRHLINMMEVIDIIRENDMFYNFYHIPQQSGSDKVLKCMNRGNDVDQFLGIIKEIRKDRYANIMTDVIVGHPEEEEDDFKQTVELIKRAMPDTTNISKFSARPGTAAAKMEQIDREIVNARSTEISKLCDSISRKRNEMWIGKTCSVVVLEKLRGSAGRNDYYKQAIIDEDDMQIGSENNVKIEEAGIAYIKGRIIR